jgi:hypothetical protein
MSIKIALTNLGKYNEGELVYTWLELPATSEELDEAFEEINVAPGSEYEEHFISDYEAPFEIGENESLLLLNELSERLEDMNVPESIIVGSYDAGDVIDFAFELENTVNSDIGEYVQDIVSDEELDELVKQQADSRGWQGVKFFLAGIDYMNDEYYWINGYGNAENLSHERLEGIVSDLWYEFKRNA